MKHSYWTGVRFWATSNAQYSIANGGWSGTVSATRARTDTYVRSVWWATCSFSSDASGAVPGWWQATSVYFVAQMDKTGTLTTPANLNSTEPVNRIAMGGMFPDRYSEPEYTPSYGVSWKSSPDGIITHTSRRKGDGVNFPRVVYGIKAADQNGYFGGVAEPTYIIRASIYGRVLWESDVP